jgi:DNA-binding CsgD family transcriptional regulator
MATAQPRLTLTEAGVARLAAEGRTDGEVADLLAIRPKTVQNHLARVYSKLGIRSRTELALLLATAPAGRARRPPRRKPVVLQERRER